MIFLWSSSGKRAVVVGATMKVHAQAYFTKSFSS